MHTRYPAQVLGHTLEGFPNWSSSLPRIGTGFQLPLLLTLREWPRAAPFGRLALSVLNAGAPGRAQGLYAVEPHLGKGALGAKFESVLLVDGAETRWLDPGLFGEVVVDESVAADQATRFTARGSDHHLAWDLGFHAAMRAVDSGEGARE